MIYVVATIELNRGMREAFLEQQKGLLPLVRAEEGCIDYTPTIDVQTDPTRAARADVVVVQEKWETLPSLQAHAVAPHMKAFREKAKHLIKSIKVEVFQTV